MSIRALVKSNANLVATLIHIIIGITIVVGIIWWGSLYDMPEELHIVTTYRPLLPQADFEYVGFDTELSAPLVIKHEDFESFIQASEGKPGQYFLIPRDGEDVVSFDYLFFVENIDVVYQYSDVVPDPEYKSRFISGTYWPMEVEYADGQIVIQRTFFDDVALYLVFIAVSGSLIYGVTAGMFVNETIEYALRKIFKLS